MIGYRIPSRLLGEFAPDRRYKTFGCSLIERLEIKINKMNHALMMFSMCQLHVFGKMKDGR